MNKKILASVMTTTALLNAIMAPAYGASTDFTDISNSFAKDAIHELVEKGILNGNGDGTFNPAGKITRQDFAIVLAKALKLDVDSAPATATFSDVPTTSYAYKYVEAAAKAELIKGMGNGNFGYGGTLSRQDMAVLFVRALGQTEADIAGKGASLSFRDTVGIADYAKDAVGYAVELGLMNGTGSNSFNPTGTATREQVAVLAGRFLNVQAVYSPTPAPTAVPSQSPTATPTPTPAPTPTATSVPVYTPAPTAVPTTTPEPTATPSEPTPAPTATATPEPSSEPTAAPDTTRPVLTLYSNSLVTQGSPVWISSNETGTVYLVPFENIPGRVEGLDQLVAIGQAAKSPVTTANMETGISTQQLPAGMYKVVAADAAGNISDPSGTLEIVLPLMQTPTVQFKNATTLEIKYNEELSTEFFPNYQDFKVFGYDGNTPYERELNEESVSVVSQSVYVDLGGYEFHPGEKLTISYQPALTSNVIQGVSGKKSPVINKVDTVYTGRDQLEDLIKEAKSLYDHAVTGTAPGQYPESVKDVLGNAILTAETLLSITQAGHGEISEAIDMLDLAIDDFRNSVIPEVNEWEVTSSPDAVFMMNRYQNNSSEVIIGTDLQIEEYSKRNIKNLVKVLHNGQEQTIQYNSTSRTYEVKDLDNNNTIELKISSANLDLVVSEGQDNISVKPAETPDTSGTAPALIFTLVRQGAEPTSFSLPVQFDNIAPEITGSSYQDGKIKLSVNEAVYTTLGTSASATLFYSASGNFETDKTLLELGNDYTINWGHPEDPKTIYLELKPEAVASHNILFGKFLVTVTNVHDFTKNALIVNELIVDLPAPN
ncbi:hypothetical protein C2I18_27760 [Paenibacillus sp. PK3_47]|uniref:S-layer homology domain-containing protein n=1 Tax=Paenibacillus sp. PK3_47 TaxID=2072642 RepID=UPI00201E46CB|nr:S-layer homology domain-containing protein [Paenibacillus sp. PK3_47]UQZ36996.1 hypothetical protein C2I18_27760 [Paenibacillus sp. PK3_47]